MDILEGNVVCEKLTLEQRKSWRSKKEQKETIMS